MKNEIKEYKEYIKQQAADPNTQCFWNSLRSSFLSG